MVRRVLVLAVLALPLAARAASLTVDVWGGVKRFDAVGLRSGAVSATKDDLLDGSYNAVGATAVLKVGMLELGAVYEGSLNYESTKTATIAPLLGLGLDAGPVRVELLGEVGGARYSSIGGSNESAWLPYAGVRPGLSLRFPVAGPLRFVVGAWGFARWDLDRSNVNVGTRDGVPDVVYRVGGTTYGVVGRVGFEI